LEKSEKFNDMETTKKILTIGTLESSSRFKNSAKEKERWIPRSVVSEHTLTLCLESSKMVPSH
jgi:hypothetical protein